MATIHIEVDTADILGMRTAAQGLMGMVGHRGVVDRGPVEKDKPELPTVVTGEQQQVDISKADDPTTFTADMPTPQSVPSMPTPELVIGSAPSMPTPATVPPLIPGGANPVTEAIELDTEGLPWDARIHAVTRTKRQSDMTWKLKRKASEELIKSVKDELRLGIMPVAVGASEPPPAPAATQPPAMPGQSEYQVLMQAVSKAIGTGRLTMTDVETACTNANLDSPQDLAVHLDRVPQVAAALGVELCQS